MVLTWVRRRARVRPFLVAACLQDTLAALERLNLSGNAIERIPALSSWRCERLRVLRLARNRLSVLADIRHLMPLQNLSSLSVLQGNDIGRLPHARAFTVHVLSSLAVLEGDAVDAPERLRARDQFARDEAEALTEQIEAQVRGA